MDLRISGSLDHTIKQLQTRKSLLTSSSTSLPSSAITLLAAMLCCPLMRKNSPSLISSHVVGFDVLFVGITHNVCRAFRSGRFKRYTTIASTSLSSFDRMLNFVGASRSLSMEMSFFVLTPKMYASSHSDQNFLYTAVMCLKSGLLWAHTTTERRSSHWQGPDVEPQKPGSHPEPYGDLQKAQGGLFSSILAQQSWTVGSPFPCCLKARVLLYPPSNGFHLPIDLLSGQTVEQLRVFAPLVFL